MQLWLASYPRSGNTFMRDVLFACYGIDSSTFHKESTYEAEKNYDQFRIVKTHLLPTEIEKKWQQIPAVYLIRDGRDALVSMAHHKKDLIDPNSSFLANLEEVIIAADGSHFGGWSANAKAWCEKADIIIRYEDFILDPIKELEKIRKVFDLPLPDISKLPTFESQKRGHSHYGSGAFHNITGDETTTFSNKNFRKGKAGGWKEEMPDFHHDLFWNYHGKYMEKMGYQYDGSMTEIDEDTYGKVKQKIYFTEKPTQSTANILIDSSKILGNTNDGIKRYVIELLRQLKDVQEWGDESLHFHVYINGRIYDIEEFEGFIDLVINNNKDYYFYESVLLGIRGSIKFILPEKLYEKLAPVYRNSGWRKKLLVIRERVSKQLFYSKVLNRKKSDSPFSIYDLVHITLPQHLPLFKLDDIPAVVTVHDISHRLFSEFHLENNIALSEKGLQEIKDKNIDVISISQSTANDIQSFYQINQTEIIPEAANTDLFRFNTNKHLFIQTLQKYNLPLDKKYFLSLSTLEPRKNIVNTIKAFQKITDPNISLIIVGKKGWQYDEILASGKDTSNIYFTGYVRDADLHVLYTGAQAFCYISHYEGFGLPLLEAMSCRTPVICGNNSSQIELIAQNGIAVDSNDVEAIYTAMTTLLNAELRESYAAMAWKKSFEYTWYKTAKQTIAFYKRIMDKLPSPAHQILR